MPLSKFKTCFTSDELRTLHRAFEMACSELELSATSHPLRDRLAVLVFEIAKTGEADPASIKARAVQAFKQATIDEREVLAQAPFAAGAALRIEEAGIASASHF